MPDQFHCPNCQGSQKPLLNILCGHTFCQECFQTLQKCPLCDGKMSPDFTIENWILIDSGSSRPTRTKTPPRRSTRGVSSVTPTPPPLLNEVEVDLSNVVLPSTILGATADLASTIQLMITEIHTPADPGELVEPTPVEAEPATPNLEPVQQESDPVNTGEPENGESEPVPDNSTEIELLDNIHSFLESRSKLRSKLGEAFIKQTANHIIDLFLEGLTTSPTEYRFSYVVKSDDYYLNSCVHRIVSEIKQNLVDLDAEVVLEGRTQTTSKGLYENNISIILPIYNLGGRCVVPLNPLTP